MLLLFPSSPRKRGSRTQIQYYNYPRHLSLDSRLRGNDIRKFVTAIVFLITAFATPAHAADLSTWLGQRLDTVTPTTAPAFIASYDTVPGKTEFDQANANAAYTYDQALAICAFLANNDIAHARRIGDALVWAQGHDRFYHDGRLRNAYAAGPAIDNPVKLPGYYKDKWIEDGYQAGSATGNNAWAGIALMRLALASDDKKYADAARRIGQWLIVNPGRDWPLNSVNTCGLSGGYEGFEPNPIRLTWFSTEHNIDALAFFRLLAKAYPQDDYSTAIDETSTFVKTMWSGERFEVGTTADGTTINKAYSALDAQILPLLALHDKKYIGAIDYAQRVHGVDGAFDYTDKRDAIWAEGSAQAALLYRTLGWDRKYKALLAKLEKDQGPDGGVYAISTEQLSTGLQLGNGGKGEPWSYYHRVHIAPVSWLIMAERGYNPLAAP